MAKTQFKVTSSGSGRVYVNMKLLLKGASRLEGFVASSQIDATTKKQKYISQLQSYLEDSGKVHQNSTNASCFATDVSSLDSLNNKFKGLEADITKLVSAMRTIAKNYMEIEYGTSSDSKMKSLLAMKGDFISAAEINTFIGNLTEADKKALAAFLQSATGAEICVGAGILSVLTKTDKGKEYVKKYIKTKCATSKKAISKAKVSEYAPSKYAKVYKTTKAARAAWKKDLVKDLKNKYNLSDSEASALADQKMKVIAERNINKAKVDVNTKYSTKTKNSKIATIDDKYKKQMAEIDKKAQAYDNEHDKAIDAAVSDDKNVKTESNSQIQQRNEEALEPAGGQKNPSRTTPESGGSSTPSGGENQPSSESNPSSETGETTTDGGGNTTVDQTQTGSNPEPVTHSGEALPAENPTQEASNFQEDVDKQRAEAVTNEVDETAGADTAVTPNEKVGSDLAEGSETTTDDNLDPNTIEDDESGTQTTIPSSSESDTSGGSMSNKKSGSSPVVPVVAGVAAAGAAGVGAKIILDRKTNTVNDGNFGSEDWGDSSNGDDYGIGDNYYENEYDNKKDDLIEDEVNNYDYKANSIDEVNLEEKEKADEEANKLSFHDNIAYDAINDAEMNA